MKKMHLAGLVLLGGLPVVAAASDPANLDYSYFQPGYTDVTVDVLGEEIDANGFGFESSIQTGANSFIALGYQQYSGDIYGIDFDGTDLSVGFGGAWATSDTSDFFATVKWLRSEADVEDFGSADDDGYGIDLGLRGQLSPGFELFGEINHVQFDGGNDTGFTIGAKFGPGFVLSYQTADDANAISIGWRFGG